MNCGTTQGELEKHSKIGENYQKKWKVKKGRKKEQDKATCIHCKYAFTPQNILRASRNDIRTELQIHGLKQSGSHFEPIKRLAEHYCKPHTHDSPWKAHDIKNLEKQYNIMNPPKGKQKRGRKKKASSKKQSKKQTNDGTRRARNRRWISKKIARQWRKWACEWDITF